MILVKLFQLASTALPNWNQKSILGFLSDQIWLFRQRESPMGIPHKLRLKQIWSFRKHIIKKERKFRPKEDEISAILYRFLTTVLSEIDES